MPFTARDILTRPPTGRYFSPALPSDCFAIDFPERAISPSEGLPILYTRYLREWPRLPFTARIERAYSYRARSASKKAPGHSFFLPSFLVFLFLSRAACLDSHCACRTSTFRACAFHEHRRPTGCPAPPLTALSTGSYNLLILLPVTD